MGQADGSLEIDPLALRDAVRAASLQLGTTGPIHFDANGDRVPRSGDDLAQFVRRTFADPDIQAFVTLGLIPCQVQDGALANLAGLGEVPLR